MQCSMAGYVYKPVVPLQATREQMAKANSQYLHTGVGERSGMADQLLLCFEKVGPAGAAARCPLLRGACARAGGATKERTGVVRGATAHRWVRISGHISHGVANGTIMPKKKMCPPRKTRLWPGDACTTPRNSPGGTCLFIIYNKQLRGVPGTGRAIAITTEQPNYQIKLVNKRQCVCVSQA